MLRGVTWYRLPAQMQRDLLVSLCSLSAVFRALAQFNRSVLEEAGEGEGEGYAGRAVAFLFVLWVRFTCRLHREI